MMIKNDLLLTYVYTDKSYNSLQNLLCILHNILYIQNTKYFSKTLTNIFPFTSYEYNYRVCFGCLCNMLHPSQSTGCNCITYKNEGCDVLLIIYMSSLILQWNLQRDPKFIPKLKKLTWRTLSCAPCKKGEQRGKNVL